MKLQKKKIKYCENIVGKGIMPILERSAIFFRWHTWYMCSTIAHTQFFKTIKTKVSKTITILHQNFIK